MLISFLLYAFIMSYTPGPNNLLALDAAAQHGLKKITPFLLGIGLGFMLLALSFVFLGEYIQHIFQPFIIIIRYVGFIYLIYLAFSMFKTKKTKSCELKICCFRDGLLLQFINPKTILYVLTAIGTFVLAEHMSTSLNVLWALLIGLIGFSAAITWALLGKLLKLYIEKYYRPYQYTMFSLLMVMAISLLF